MAEYSFDIVCKVNKQYLNNAVQATQKEIGARFDFKNVATSIKVDENTLALECSDKMHLEQMIDILKTKMFKQNLDIKALQFSPYTHNVSGAVKCIATLQNGLSQEQSKKITKSIAAAKIKVQARIQGESIRVSAKSKDLLQQVQEMAREQASDFAVQFENYR